MAQRPAEGPAGGRRPIDRGSRRSQLQPRRPPWSRPTPDGRAAATGVAGQDASRPTDYALAGRPRRQRGARWRRRTSVTMNCSIRGGRRRSWRSCPAQLSWDEQTYLAAGRSRPSGRTAQSAGRHGSRAIHGAPAGRIDQPSWNETANSARRRRPSSCQSPRSPAPLRPRDEAADAARGGDFAGHVAGRSTTGSRHGKNPILRRFRPWLEKIVALKREEAAALGHGIGNGVPYDALLDDYEPGAKTADVAQVFAGLRAGLVPLVQAIRSSSKRPDVSILTRHYPKDAQAAFARAAATAIGFRFRGRPAGRIGPSVLQRHRARATAV